MGCHQELGEDHLAGCFPNKAKKYLHSDESECLGWGCKCNNEHFGTRKESGWWLKFHSYLCLWINTINTEMLCPGVAGRLEVQGVTVQLESSPDASPCSGTMGWTGGWLPLPPVRVDM